MTRSGVDYSTSRPNPAALKEAGYTFACRYTSKVNAQTTGKILSAAEAQTLAAAGIDIVANYEWYAGRMKEGYDAGVADAQIGHEQAADAGMPLTRPIYFSADWDAREDEQNAINQYLEGTRDVLGAGRTGIYGSYYVLTRAAAYWASAHPGETLWLWQTYAWSGGAWCPGAHLRQTRNGATVAGASVDINQAQQDDFGQWKAGQADPFLYAHTTEDDDMIYDLGYLPTDRFAYDENGNCIDPSAVITKPIDDVNSGGFRNGPAVWACGADQTGSANGGKGTRIRLATTTNTILNSDGSKAFEVVETHDIDPVNPRISGWLKDGTVLVSIGRQKMSPKDDSAKVRVSGTVTYGPRNS